MTPLPAGAVHHGPLFDWAMVIAMVAGVLAGLFALALLLWWDRRQKAREAADMKKHANQHYDETLSHQQKGHR